MCGKATIEDSSSSYYADPGVENFKLHLGTTALIVLTEDFALRLIQVGKFWLSYDLRLHLHTRAAFSGCALCADESEKRPVCHRSINISIGQVKLEADRRLELLFALLETLTYDSTLNDAKDEAEDDSASEKKVTGTDSSQENASLRHRGRRERKRSLLRRFAEESLRTTIVKRVLVQGLMIVDVPVDIHAGEVEVEKENLCGNSFVVARFDLCLCQL
ncbi:hypothetical protein PsorP6_009703 [Peronosclerospora sorghi]|uniref:Uncharacterized protein n=1 Tax=Peronosclerospora sorghi TaxID=230839 RepID=A0ACC0W0Q0_9STRA|nr:hypothetical protein PsorP6_009703 [Peronosclerospora sorghi]